MLVGIVIALRQVFLNMGQSAIFPAPPLFIARMRVRPTHVAVIAIYKTLSMPIMATAREDRNSTSEPPGCPLERALIANEMRVYSEQDKVLLIMGR